MALHCPATLLLVESEDHAPSHVVAAHGPWGPDVDVVSELQAVADLHRGERVLVRLSAGGVAQVLGLLGRAAPDGTARARLDIGDDGWVVLPFDGEE